MDWICALCSGKSRQSKVKCERKIAKKNNLLLNEILMWNKVVVQGNETTEATDTLRQLNRVCHSRYYLPTYLPT
jgi:hypothetical protein